jgi:nicotinate-nucleotide adenylyltransferase
MSGGDRPRVGVLGGTFNPIHLGHLRAAEEVAEALELERVVFVPSARPPHKPPGDAALARAELRLAWVRLAVEGNPRFAVDTVEMERSGPSYLVETLPELSRRHAGRDLVFLLGRDAFAEMATWREPERLLTLADYAVMTRPPLRGSLAQWLPGRLAGDFEIAPDGRSARHRGAGTRILLVEITALDISASEIRARLREGRSVRYLLPEAVRGAVAASGAYGPGAQG